ncbi:hypothetical protein C3L33_10320, partial [Rhododendron williamsianum]
MGWNKLSVRKIDNQTSRQVMYSKRKDAIVKKASELSVLCDTDVGLLMFSPTGLRISSCDLLAGLRTERGAYMDEEYLSGRLKQLKQEGEMLEKIAKYYNPNVENIDSLFEAGVYQQFLENAIERVEQSKIASFNVREEDPNTDESANSNIIRNLSSDEQYPEEAYSLGPHLSLQFLKAQKNWNLA